MPLEEDFPKQPKDVNEHSKQPQNDTTDKAFEKRVINPALLQKGHGIVSKIPIPSSKTLVATSSSTSSSFQGSVFGFNDTELSKGERYLKRFPSTPEFVVVKNMKNKSSKPVQNNKVLPKGIPVACAHIGKPAPTFKGNAVVGGEFKQMKLSDYAGDYLVLYFYPYDFSPTCYNEIIGLSERVDDFLELNCKFVAVSTDSHYCHRAWYHSALKKSGLEYIIPLLADKNGSISNTFNVYSDITGVAQSSLFIIDEKNIVRHVQFIDANVQFSLDETFRLVQAFKYSDAHGAMCPAGWKPGDDAIKPTVESAKIFFEKHN